MSSTVTVLSIIFSVILGNILCAEINNRNTQQNPWQRLNTSNYDYNTQGKSPTTPWPALGRPRNQQTNFQATTPAAPLWVRPNNGPNWVRNTPPPQNSNNPYQNFNPQPQQNFNNAGGQNRNNLYLNNERTAFASNQNGGYYNRGGTNTFINPPNGNYPIQNTFSNNRPNQNAGFNQGGTAGNYPRPNSGVNTVYSSGSGLTDSEDVGRTNQGAYSSQNVDVDDNELRELSEELLNKDVNNPAQYVNVNFQGMTSSRSSSDEAPLPLLTINQAAYSEPTISKLLLLHDNYIVQAKQAEVYTAQEKNEENDLLTVVVDTPVMQHTRNFLMKKGKIGRDPQEFKDLLRLIWFNMYSRAGGKVGSSGFEHVFLGELKNNQVSGLHNWLYFNEEEKKNEANYLGYMKKIDLGGRGYILKFHFTFHGVDKPVGSMFIGTSPELEMALYSACFILRPDKICPLKMNGNRFIIRTYTYRYKGKNTIGSAFPEI